VTRLAHTLTNSIKLLATSTRLLEADLARIEREFEISLGRPAYSEADQDYYPQFDGDLRSEAAEMSRHYELFYCLEKSIRRFIADTLEETAGPNWWGTAVPQAVQEGASKAIQRELDSAVTIRSNDPIDYTTFGELGEIIKNNWDLFGATFSSQRAVERVMANLNVLRGPIAHCSRLAEDEILRLRLSMRDWFRIME
jgi:hypothetical protein